MNKRTKTLTHEQYDAILTWIILGVVVGGRLGYVIFYKSDYYLQNPLEALYVWQGGMSFHGGMLGVIGAIYLFSRQGNYKILWLQYLFSRSGVFEWLLDKIFDKKKKNITKEKINFLKIMDMVAVAAPMGLFLGRIANFINGELYGRATTHWVGMIFPTDPQQIPRHPSQLYEAALEGLVLGIIMFIAFKIGKWKQAGFLSGLFLIGYGAFRSIAELFREPDAHLGFIVEGLTMGQLLSFPMVLLGLYLAFKSRK